MPLPIEFEQWQQNKKTDINSAKALYAICMHGGKTHLQVLNKLPKSNLLFFQPIVQLFI